VADACEQPSDFRLMCQDDDSIEVKIEKVAKKAYGASEVVFYLDAQRRVRQYHEDGLDKLPICMCGDIQQMPGIGKTPAALNVDIEGEGRTVGLFCRNCLALWGLCPH
jgi:formate--tetrahydrofolate ligase